jgi:hypothetical protein
VSDEPKFLNYAPMGQPAPPGRDPVRPALPPELREAVARATDAAMPAILETATRASKRRWDDDAVAPSIPVEHVLGGLRITVPGRWQQEPPDPRGIAWVIDEGAVVSLTGMGFEKRVPTPMEYVEARPVVAGDGYMRVTVAELPHPTGHAAAEVIECHTGDPRRPVRVLRVLHHPDMLLILKMDADGWFPARAGAEFAHAFRTIG